MNAPPGVLFYKGETNMAMRPEDLTKLTGELVDEMGPAGFLLRATEVYLLANVPDICDRDDCTTRVHARAGELAMRAVMDEGQPNVLGRAITSLTEYAQAVCGHLDEEFLVLEGELATATV
jgi:hypothetical protein